MIHDDNRRRRRVSDAEQIDDLRADFVKCSSDMSDGISKLNSQLRAISEKMQDVTIQISDLDKTIHGFSYEITKYRELGLLEIIQSHNDSKGFRQTTGRYARFILGISAVGGAILAIFMGILQGIKYIVNNGVIK